MVSAETPAWKERAPLISDAVALSYGMDRIFFVPEEYTIYGYGQGVTSGVLGLGVLLLAQLISVGEK